MPGSEALMAVMYHGARSWAGLVCGCLAEAIALEVLGSYARTGVRWGNELVDAICDTRQSASLWGKSLVARRKRATCKKTPSAPALSLRGLEKLLVSFALRLQDRKSTRLNSSHLG